MKLTFDEVLDRINDGRSVDANDVQARALRRKVWIAEWHIPGCLSESFNVCLSKGDAIAQALEFCGHVRGAKTDLQCYGRTDRVAPDAYVNLATTTIYRTTLGGLS